MSVLKCDGRGHQWTITETMTAVRNLFRGAEAKFNTLVEVHNEFRTHSSSLFPSI